MNDTLEEIFLKIDWDKRAAWSAARSVPEYFTAARYAPEYAEYAARYVAWYVDGRKLTAEEEVIDCINEGEWDCYYDDLKRQIAEQQ